MTIVGTDYTFSVPASLPPGPTAFTFENHGKVMHEMSLVLPFGPSNQRLHLSGGVFLKEAVQL